MFFKPKVTIEGRFYYCLLVRPRSEHEQQTGFPKYYDLAHGLYVEQRCGAD